MKGSNHKRREFKGNYWNNNNQRFLCKYIYKFYICNISMEKIIKLF